MAKVSDNDFFISR